MKVQVEPARAHDLAPALELLRRCGLPTDGVADCFGHYVVVRDDADIVGLAGLEIHGHDALLRSVAVDPDARGQGLGGQLVAAAEALAGHMDLSTIYLLTTSADGFFGRLGYASCSRDAVPEGVRESWEFRMGFPATATLMKKNVR